MEYMPHPEAETEEPPVCEYCEEKPATAIGNLGFVVRHIDDEDGKTERHWTSCHSESTYLCDDCIDTFVNEGPPRRR